MLYTWIRLGKAQSYVLRQLEDHLNKVENGSTKVRDYKTMLQELVQRKADSHVVYELLCASGLIMPRCLNLL